MLPPGHRRQLSWTTLRRHEPRKSYVNQIEEQWAVDVRKNCPASPVGVLLLNEAPTRLLRKDPFSRPGFPDCHLYHGLPGLVCSFFLDKPATSCC